MSSTVSARLHADLLEQNYALWKNDTRSVDATWAAFFEGFELGLAQPPKRDASPAPTGRAGTLSSEDLTFRAKVATMVFAFRALGHTAVWLDPLSDGPPEQPRLSLEALGFTPDDLSIEVATQFFQNGAAMPLSEMFERLRATYCDRIGFEFAHIQNADVRDWLVARIEGRPPEAGADQDNEGKHVALAGRGRVVRDASSTRNTSGKSGFRSRAANRCWWRCTRFSSGGPAQGVREIVMGMAHRGRLSVLATFLKKPLKVLLHEFSENYVPVLVAGDGDVKYHLGYEITRETAAGEAVTISLAANPSHLEAVDPVVEGKARARQRELGDLEERKSVLPLLIHGDAAISARGSWRKC